MERYLARKARRRRWLTTTGVCAGIYTAAVLLLLGISMALNWELRAEAISCLALLAALLAVSFAAALLYWLAAVCLRPGQRPLIRLGCVGCAVGFLAVFLLALWMGVLLFAFSVNTERTAVIDGEKYVARLEDHGDFLAGTSGMSYHKIHGIFCEADGWEVEYDQEAYELWESYS